VEIPVPLNVLNSTNIDPVTTDYLDIFSFTLAETDNVDVRKLFVANYTKTIYSI
jgi:hypothetical protein